MTELTLSCPLFSPETITKARAFGERSGMVSAPAQSSFSIILARSTTRKDVSPSGPTNLSRRVTRIHLHHHHRGPQASAPAEPAPSLRNSPLCDLCVRHCLIRLRGVARPASFFFAILCCDLFRFPLHHIPRPTLPPALSRTFPAPPLCSLCSWCENPIRSKLSRRLHPPGASSAGPRSVGSTEAEPR
ncbi:hypothetical protein BH09VER1_BH09VER1_05540 [soil metagenome]